MVQQAPWSCEWSRLRSQRVRRCSFPMIFSALIPKVGWSRNMRVTGFVRFVLCLLSIMLCRARLPTKKLGTPENRYKYLLPVSTSRTEPVPCWSRRLASCLSSGPTLSQSHMCLATTSSARSSTAPRMQPTARWQDRQVQHHDHRGTLGLDLRGWPVATRLPL